MQLTTPAGPSKLRTLFLFNFSFLLMREAAGQAPRAVRDALLTILVSLGVVNRRAKRKLYGVFTI